jgi:hypothetical protein
MQNELKRLGFSSVDEALSAKWDEIPEDLRKHLMGLGFKPKD